MKYSEEIRVQANADIFNFSIFKMKINPAIDFHKCALAFLREVLLQKLY